jgi:hypothetical protein
MYVGIEVLRECAPGSFPSEVREKRREKEVADEAVVCGVCAMHTRGASANERGVLCGVYCKGGGDVNTSIATVRTYGNSMYEQRTQ